MVPPKGMDDTRLLDQLLRHLVLIHPLPWHVEYDWTCEVRAKDNALIVKCHNVDEARAFITRAEALALETLKSGDAIERELELMDEDTRLGRTNRCRFFGCANVATHADPDVETGMKWRTKEGDVVFTSCCPEHAGPQAHPLTAVPSDGDVPRVQADLRPSERRDAARAQAYPGRRYHFPLRGQ